MKFNSGTEEISVHEVDSWYQVTAETWEIVQVGDRYEDRRDMSEEQSWTFGTLEDAREFFDGIEFTEDDFKVFDHPYMPSYSYVYVRVSKCAWDDEDRLSYDFSNDYIVEKDSIPKGINGKIDRDQKAYWDFLDYKDAAC